MINPYIYREQDCDVRSLALIDHNSYTNYDMKILSTLLYGQLGLIMPLAGSLRTVGAPVHVFFRSSLV